MELFLPSWFRSTVYWAAISNFNWIRVATGRHKRYRTRLCLRSGVDAGPPRLSQGKHARVDLHSAQIIYIRKKSYKQLKENRQRHEGTCSGRREYLFHFHADERYIFVRNNIKHIGRSFPRGTILLGNQPPTNNCLVSHKNVILSEKGWHRRGGRQWRHSRRHRTGSSEATIVYLAVIAW